MPKINDLTGRVFGRLTVERIGERDDKKRTYRWHCVCSCGNRVAVLGAPLVAGGTTSCGCYRTEIISQRNAGRATHGMSKSPEYGIWAQMIRRCENPRHEAYERYGGRGIVVCAEWRASFPAFLSSVGYRPSPQHSLDRIENDRGYEPGNVRWATQREQSNNRRSNAILEIDGVRHTAAELDRIHGLRPKTVARRLRAGLTGPALFAKPVGHGMGKAKNARGKSKTTRRST